MSESRRCHELARPQAPADEGASLTQKDAAASAFHFSDAAAEVDSRHADDFARDSTPQSALKRAKARRIIYMSSGGFGRRQR